MLYQHLKNKRKKNSVTERSSQRKQQPLNVFPVSPKDLTVLVVSFHTTSEPYC